MHITIDQLDMAEENEFCAFAEDLLMEGETFNYSTLTTDVGNGQDFQLVGQLQDLFYKKLYFEQKNSELRLVIYKA